MAFVHGKSTVVLFNQHDLSEYFDNANLSNNSDTAEITPFGSNSKKYIPGLKDATVSLEGLYDGSADAVDEILESVFATEGNELSVYPEGDVFSKPGYSMLAIETAYSTTGTVDGACRISAAVQSSDTAAERVISLHELGAQAAENWTGSTLNSGAASAAGGSAYLHASAATGTIEVSIHHSNDNFAADDDELAAFTAVTGATSQRVAFTGAVKQYIRGVATIGAAETITFQLGFHRA